MALAFFQDVLCCYRPAPTEPEGQYDESSHLIPRAIEPSVSYTDRTFIDHQSFQARLGDIVRAKEGKMVNVASHIPFNLHNQVIPVEASLSRSRSVSESGEYDETYHPSQTYFDVYTNRTSARRRKRHPYIGNVQGHIESEAGPSNTRSQSPTTVQPRPMPILNLRLVGYSDLRTRGRTKERGPKPSGLPSSRGDNGQSPPQLSIESPEGDKSPQPTAADLQFYNIGPIVISWGD